MNYLCILLNATGFDAAVLIGSHLAEGVGLLNDSRLALGIE